MKRALIKYFFILSIGFLIVFYYSSKVVELAKYHKGIRLYGEVDERFLKGVDLVVSSYECVNQTEIKKFLYSFIDGEREIIPEKVKVVESKSRDSKKGKGKQKSYILIGEDLKCGRAVLVISGPVYTKLEQRINEAINNKTPLTYKHLAPVMNYVMLALGSSKPEKFFVNLLFLCFVWTFFTEIFFYMPVEEILIRTGLGDLDGNSFIPKMLRMFLLFIRWIYPIVLVYIYG